MTEESTAKRQAKDSALRICFQTRDICWNWALHPASSSRELYLDTPLDCASRARVLKKIEPTRISALAEIATARGRMPAKPA